ncbi:hypothetical protein N9Y67_04170 [Pseudomonadota bacterium]|nr:hypothetical protein [Pseudomonadota bacterium]
MNVVIKGLIISSLILLTACTSTGSVKNYTGSSSSTVKPQRIQITEVETNRYNLRYNGLLKDSLQDAQDNWIKNASEVCKSNKFTYKVTKQGFVSNYQQKPAKVSTDLSGLCVTGGAVGCIIASIFSTDSNNSNSAPIGSSFAAVEGLVMCEINGI